MENKNALMSTAILSYIWHERKIDNLDLLRPFVLNIIANDYSIGDKVDCDFIIISMEKKYGFYKMPLAILQKILNRLSSDKEKVLKRQENNYLLIKNITKEKEDFNKKQESANNEINYVISDLKKWLVSKNVIDEKFTDEDVKNAIIRFLEKNGYTIVKNIDNVYKWNNNDTIINYNICKYILEQYEKKSDFYKYFYKIVQGFMISNVMYLQFNTNIKQSFKGVEFYLDSPLLLRVLGFKTKQENRVANELINLLISQGAIIKCFEHNYKEVEGIIEGYKINKFNRVFKIKKDIVENSYEQTLEFFDDEKYEENDIEIVLTGLRTNFSEKNIKIVDCPNIDKNKEHNLDFKGLTKYIKENYSRETKEKTIYADISSINAINILRQGKKFQTIEESKAVFVTLNYTFINIIDRYFNITKYDVASLCINDVHLTSLLWMKNNVKNSDLSELKLISSIIAGFDMPNNMINRIKSTLLKIEKYSPGDVDVIMNKVLTIQTSHAIMEITGGDINKIDEKNILDAIEEEKSKELTEKTKLVNKYESLIEEMNKQKENELLEKTKNKEFLIKKETERILNIVRLIIYIISVLMIVGMLFFIYKLVLTETQITSQNVFIQVVIYVFTFLGYCGTIYAIIPYKRYKKIVDKFILKIELNVSKLKKQKYEML